MAPRKKPPPKVDLAELGAHVLSVFGPFNSRVLIEMPAEAAAELFSEPLGAAGRTNTVDAVERDLDAIRGRSPELADSALAATAMQLARELEHPFNSATSKSMCAKVLVDTLSRLRELSPPQRKKDDVDRIRDDLAEQRAKHARESAAADSSGA